MKSLLVSIIVVLPVVLNTTVISIAAASPPNVQDTIVKLVLTATGLSAVSSDQFDYFQMSNGLISPNYLISDRSFIAALDQFNNIPSATGRGFEAQSIPARLTSLRSNIEYSKQVLSDEDKNDLKAAQSVLYASLLHLTPSDGYKAYLRYQKDYDDLTAQLSVASADQRSLILARMRQVERDWTLFGHKADILAALSSIDKFKVSNASELAANWLASLPDSIAISPKVVADAFSATNWVKLTSSSSELRNTGAASLGTRSVPLPGLARLSFEFVLAGINRPGFQDPFLSDRTWRLKNGQTLSGVAPGANASIVPRYVSSLILVRNVEFVFDQEVGQPTFANIDSESSANVDNFELRADGRGCVIYQPKYLQSCSISVLGFVVSHLPLTPNPASDRVWNPQ